MQSLLQQVEESIRRHRLLRRGSAVLVAVSGGLDSMVLLQVLAALAPKHQWRLSVAHFNHRLRGVSSLADERLVRRIAQELRLPLVAEAAEVRAFAKTQRLSLEMAARQLRHKFLVRAARRLSIGTVALAHHADDQVELFFLRLLRGAGSEGLSGMKWAGPSPADPSIRVIRPLLDQSRSTLRAWAADHRVRFREDASNQSLDFARNRIRHELLPLLRKLQPSLEAVVLRLMDLVGAESEFVANQARVWLEGWGLPTGDTGEADKGRLNADVHDQAAGDYKDSRPPVLELRPRSDRAFQLPPNFISRLRFEELPVAVQRRCLLVQLTELGISASYDLVEQLRLNPDRPAPVPGTKPGNEPRIVVRDRTGRISLQGAQAPDFDFASQAVALARPAGHARFGGLEIAWRIRPLRGPITPKPAAGRELFDADKVGDRIVLRHWQPGDRFQPIGMAAPLKLQDWFTNLKVPREMRHRLVVAAAANGELFWVEGQRISERFKLSANTTRSLHWRWKRL